MHRKTIDLNAFPGRLFRWPILATLNGWWAILLSPGGKPVKGGSAMPSYEYECEKCGEKFTLKLTFEEHDQSKQVKCPKCGGQRAQRVIAAVFAKTSKKS
jgi:putative FmdB family regulatory protein